MTIKVRCPCGNTVEEPDWMTDRTSVCPKCHQAIRMKLSAEGPEQTPSDSGKQFCRHCNAETPHEGGAIAHATYLSNKGPGLWGLFSIFKRIAVERCLTCGHLELFVPHSKRT